jgi:hypothetical protein
MKNEKNYDWQIIAIFVLLFSVSACSIDGLDPLAINGIDGMVKMVHQYQSPHSLWRYSINH